MGVVGVGSAGSWEPWDFEKLAEGTPNEPTKKIETQIFGTHGLKFLTTPLICFIDFNEFQNWVKQKGEKKLVC